MATSRWRSSAEPGRDSRGRIAARGARHAYRAVASALLAFALTACEDAEAPDHLRVVGGDPDRGRTLIVEYGCNSCHVVPEIRGPRAHVGPPLTDFGHRKYIAGHLPNQPDNLVSWLRHPTAIDPRTAMPDVGLSDEEARHIAAFLYGLR